MIIKDMQLILFSTNPLFENWFERHRLKTLPLTISLEPPFSLSIPYQSSFRTGTLGLRVHTLDADLLRPVPDQADAVEYLASFPVLELRFFESSPGRMVFQMDCLHEKMIRYCLDILSEFEKFWPETMGQLSRPITRLLKAEDQYASDPNWNFLAGLALPAQGSILTVAELQARHARATPEPAMPEQSVAAVPIPARSTGWPAEAAGNPDSLSGRDYAERWDRLNEETKTKFRTAWKIYQNMLREYQNEVLDGVSKKSQPTVQDFRARILVKMGWKVGERRLYEVIELGEAGLIH
jgi:hypothetical protein